MAYQHERDEFIRPSQKAILLLYLVLSLLFSAVILCSTWPTVNLIWKYTSPDLRFAVMVASAGFLGSSVFTISSFVNFIGADRFKKSWLLWYFIQGLVGAVIALIFYLSIRGMILNGDIDTKYLNAYGITTVSMLAGLFSSHIYAKLGQVIKMILGQKSDVENQLEKINKTLGVATLDNYKGFACIEIRNSDNYLFDIRAGKVRLKAGYYRLVMCFQPESNKEQAAEFIQLTDGNDVEIVNFTISAKSEVIQFQPSKLSFDFPVNGISNPQTFFFQVPNEGYQFDSWIEVSQKNRLVAVLPLIIVNAEMEKNATYESYS